MLVYMGRAKNNNAQCIIHNASKYGGTDLNMEGQILQIYRSDIM